ncbi:probable hexokinase-like 2 protein [Prosopis cineraria]|uniref:probable hexokinase-like 2 protein n=1 Tax=Prosopis cineraria TaxID=364024 RepID=UPI00240EFC37|nr:probable hexokinase-like 2 protein [Prosopis cineraria]
MRKEVVVIASLGTTLALVAAVGLIKRWKKKKERQGRQTRNLVRKFARECATPVKTLWLVADDLVSDMKASLASSSDEATTLKMIISYAASLPNGEEEGFFYGVNMRSTNFLILCARLRGKNSHVSDLDREEISFPPDLLDATRQVVFEFVATEIAKFIVAHPEKEISNVPKKLGFTLSNLVGQAGTTLNHWKTFSAEDPVGKEMVNDFNQALKNHGINNIQVVAMVEDTVGGLSGGRYYSRDNVAAVTLGMSTNAVYVESSQDVPRWIHQKPESGELVISTEWRNFRSSHLPLTQFDDSLDAESSNPGGETFGKVVSGMYLGEIVRRVLLKLAQETALFGDRVPPQLMIPYQLRAPDMAAMHQDTSEYREVVMEKLREVFGITDSSEMAREVVAEVCDIVTERGARLAAAGIVGMVKKLERIQSRRSVVTVEGGLYEHYRIFRNYLHSGVWEMLGNDLSDNVIIQTPHGGAGTGALFLAASQTHYYS